MADDQQPEPVPILASDAEREQSVSLLRDAVVAGRLTLEEFSERVERAQTARTGGELAALSRDLPAPVTDGGSATQATAGAAGLPAPSAEQHRAICSHLIRKGPWSLPERSAWRSVFGTIDLDLRQARLSGAETVLEVYNLFGTVTVIVPDGVEVTVTGGGLFASQKLELPHASAGVEGVRLRIDTRGPGGTLHVRSGPTFKESLQQSLKDSVKRAING